MLAKPNKKLKSAPLYAYLPLAPSYSDSEGYEQVNANI